MALIVKRDSYVMGFLIKTGIRCYKPKFNNFKYVCSTKVFQENSPSQSLIRQLVEQPIVRD